MGELPLVGTMTLVQDGRLEGWKRIAAYLGRDESTVKRWEVSRDLPIRRLRGAGRSPVYALAAELDRWRETRADEEIGPMLPAARRGRTTATGRLGARPFLLLLPVALAGLAALVALPWIGPRSAAHAQPAIDPGARELYEQGQFALEQRTAASLAKASTDFSQATARDPRFAAAYSALAEMWLLSREYDKPAATTAYPRAEAAAHAALALDADDPAGHRVLGFVDFWWHQDIHRARAEFARALALAPDAARTHHWYANVLDNAGDHMAALQQIERARLLSPNSAAIEADRAKMLLHRDPAQARVALAQLIAFAPDNRSAWAYLAELEFAEGHDLAFLTAARREATIRGDPIAVTRDDRHAAIYRREGHAALIAAMRAAFIQVSGHAPTDDPFGFATQGTNPDH